MWDGIWFGKYWTEDVGYALVGIGHRMWERTYGNVLQNERHGNMEYVT